MGAHHIPQNTVTHAADAVGVAVFLGAATGWLENHIAFIGSVLAAIWYGLQLWDWINARFFMKKLPQHRGKHWERPHDGR